ncbi:MAG: hypothetical protein P4L59_16825 [Desulfosporosinus sp.]|nr:hypothetical protein [Desulfosporosinus sp.]
MDFRHPYIKAGGIPDFGIEGLEATTNRMDSGSLFHGMIGGPMCWYDEEIRNRKVFLELSLVFSRAK